MFVSSFQIISRPDSQSQLQMFTLFSVCHVGGAKRSTNLIGDSILDTLGSEICEKHFDEYMKFGKTQGP